MIFIVSGVYTFAKHCFLSSRMCSPVVRGRARRQKNSEPPLIYRDVASGRETKDMPEAEKTAAGAPLLPTSHRRIAAHPSFPLRPLPVKKSTNTNLGKRLRMNNRLVW